ncbi:hypothetical protein PC117_g16147 [Phytophthora cactorum]|uniref:Uncharacterized protein n=1 Tax=Phytophthora cactorum TaxID=29920 RepID=A0A8T1CEP1_9STRA|nr:hypothetical protein PC117_g16147 [Phytophthora cactorum]
MTPRYVWKTVCSDMAREDSQLLMEDMKVFIIVKSQLVPCSVCALTRRVPAGRPRTNGHALSTD